jgi:hypothetical protein
MNFFKPKNKKIQLQCHTTMQSLIDLFPPEVNKEGLPSWYKDLPKEEGWITIRHCNGFQDLYKNSIIIRSWSDIDIEVRPDGSIAYDFACKDEIKVPLERHHIDSQAASAWPGYCNIKLMSPWYFKTENMHKWLMLAPTWDQKDPLEFGIVPGVVEFKYQHVTNINCLLKLKPEPYTIHIKAGQALVQLLPLFDEDWEMNIELFDDRDWVKYFGRWNHAFGLSYQKTRAMLEKKKK